MFIDSERRKDNDTVSQKLNIISWKNPNPNTFESIH
jgi:hypothetical protein